MDIITVIVVVGVISITTFNNRLQQKISRGIVTKKKLNNNREEGGRTSSKLEKKLVKFRHDRFYGTTKAVLPTHRTKLDINLNYAPWSFPPFSPCPLFARGCRDERELLHRQQQARLIESIKSAAWSALCSPLIRPSPSLRRPHRRPPFIDSLRHASPVHPRRRLAVSARDIYRSWFFISAIGFVTVHFSPIALDPPDWLLIYDRRASRRPSWLFDKCAFVSFARHTSRAWCESHRNVALASDWFCDTFFVDWRKAEEQ